MTMALGRFTHWLWPGSSARVSSHELPTPSTALMSSSFPDFPSGFREPDTVTFSAAGGGRRTRQRRVRNRRRSHGEPRVDREYDMVIVPSDGGGCLSGTESDDSDGGGCKRTVTRRPASPSSFPATATAASSSLRCLRAASLAPVLSPTVASLMERIL